MCQEQGSGSTEPELYEKLHPDTQLGATGKGRAEVRQNGEANNRFTRDAATKTGKSERTIQREIARAAKITGIADVPGTSLDEPDELDALAKLPEPVQRDLIAKAKTGESVSAKPIARNFPREAEPKTPRGVTTLVNFITYRGEKVPYRRSAKPERFLRQENDQIEWAGWSWNPVEGCLRNCKFGDDGRCYAEGNANSPRLKRVFPAGFTPIFGNWRLDAPKNTPFPLLEEIAKNPGLGRVFVCSQGDLFGNWVEDDLRWIEQVFAACCANPQWQYHFLTKYPGRYVGLKFPATAWVGTSVHEQKLV
jgi:Protein of unknown function (DUF5131)